MIEVISGTDRPDSHTLKVANYVMGIYREQHEAVDLIDIAKLDMKDVATGDYYKGPQGTYKEAEARVAKAEGLVIVVPEYNGSYPGSLKLFIDYWRYPATFEHRPVAFIGLGARWGGLRPIEHLQQVFGYRNAYCFPQRVFLSNIRSIFKDGKVDDQLLHGLIETQAKDFLKFVNALKAQGLDANTRIALAAANAAAAAKK